MDYVEFETGKFIVSRAPHDADLVQFITDLAKEKDVRMGAFTAIGALKRAKLGFYNQESHEYQENEINHPCEIASCIGNISLKDDEPFVHAHAVLADEDGNTKAGHLSEGKVFAAEIHLQVLEGSELKRKRDGITDLSLWKIR